MRTGFAFHVHHDVLVELCFDYDERVRYIREFMPAAQRGLRLRLFNLIPPDRLPAPLLKAGKAYLRAKQNFGKSGQNYGMSVRTYIKVRVACNEAMRACMPQLEALHKELCPDCPWDGETIFPPGEKEIDG